MDMKLNLPETDEEIDEFIRAVDAGEIECPTAPNAKLLARLCRLYDRVEKLEDMLRSAHAIAERKGEGTAWVRFAARIKALEIGSVTPRTFRILGDDDPEILGQND